MPMARQISKHPSSTGKRVAARTASLAFTTSGPVASRKRVAAVPGAKEKTIEDRLIAKAKAADHRNHTGQQNLADMSREELHAFLSGEG
jgi:hypothetical protein